MTVIVIIAIIIIIIIVAVVIIMGVVILCLRRDSLMDFELLELNSADIDSDMCNEYSRRYGTQNSL